MTAAASSSSRHASHAGSQLHLFAVAFDGPRIPLSLAQLSLVGLRQDTQQLVNAGAGQRRVIEGPQP